MSASQYEHLTYDLTLAAADALEATAARLTFCYVSGEGTDGTERGCSAWARVKGKTDSRRTTWSGRCSRFSAASRPATGRRP